MPRKLRRPKKAADKSTLKLIAFLKDPTAVRFNVPADRWEQWGAILMRDADNPRSATELGGRVRLRLAADDTLITELPAGVEYYGARCVRTIYKALDS